MVLALLPSSKLVTFAPLLPPPRVLLEPAAVVAELERAFAVRFALLPALSLAVVILAPSLSLAVIAWHRSKAFALQDNLAADIEHLELVVLTAVFNAM